MNGILDKGVLRAALALVFSCGGAAWAGEVVAEGDFWKADHAIYGDGRVPSASHTKGMDPKPHGFRLDYKIDVPESGWYTLTFLNADNGLSYDVEVDDQFEFINGKTVKAGDAGTLKGGNLYLEKGPRTLRLKRTGRNSFPLCMFDRFELRKSSGDAAESLRVRKSGHDVLRRGESFALDFMAGGNNRATTYTLSRADVTTGKSEKVAEVVFAASAKPERRRVEIPCPVEGIFQITAEADGKALAVNAFADCYYVVVDTRAGGKTSPGPMEVLYDIDCVKQTDRGAPLADGQFVEANGPTRIAKSEAGEYRESHDCTPPEATVVPGVLNASLSGFSYRIVVPEAQVPYLLELDYPDDARRSVTVANYWFTPGTGTLDDQNGGYQGKSYETGGFFPITGQRATHRVIFWPTTTEGSVNLFSMQAGHRAAAARIRISRFPNGEISGASSAAPANRLFTSWFEEGTNYEIAVGARWYGKHPLLRAHAGLDRWLRMTRYFGANSFSGIGAGYQTAYWPSKLMEGFSNQAWDTVNLSRLGALLCEKYGMKFIPEFFPMQQYLHNVLLAEQVKDPRDLRAINCNGGERGPGVTACDANPLHPVIQDRFIAVLGELADTLRDSPAFGGVTVRADSWGFRGEFFYPSIHWGYGDWTMAQFEKDTGIQVPAKATGPELSAGRFQFLTAPDMIGRWNAWRIGRIEDYHKRILARIRGERRDIFFGIVGSFDCDRELYGAPDALADRAAGSGVDIARRAVSDGLAVVPVGRYGTRIPNEGARRIYDGFFKTDNVRGGMGVPRAFASYFTYHEIPSNWPAKQLGIEAKKGRTLPYYCSAALAANRNALERYAVVLAEQDTAYMREGGNTDSFSDPELLRPWMAEYAAIPNTPFTPAPGVNDPVAVWWKNLDPGMAERLGVAPGFYFYAVNRERIPVRTTIRLDGAGPTVRLATGETLELKDGALTFDLEPFGLRAYGARSVGAAKLVSASSELPEADRDYLHRRLAFAQDVAARSDDPKYAATLRTAWTALEAGRPWRARVELDMAEMMDGYVRAGQLPEGMLNTAFPDKLVDSGKRGHWLLQEPVAAASNLTVLNKDACILRDTETVNPQWRGEKTLWTDKGEILIQLSVEAEGKYALTLGQVASGSGMAFVSLNGQALPEPLMFRTPNVPAAATFAPVELKPGKVELRVRSSTPFGLYGVRFLPVMRPIPGTEWKVAGRFPSRWGPFHGMTDDLVKEALMATYPAEKALNDDARFKTEDGQEFGWRFALPGITDALSPRGVHMPLRTFSSAGGVNIAVTRIHADRDRTAILTLAPDWWATATLNGERLVTNIAPKMLAATHADFNSNQPVNFSVLNLKQGDNVLVVKIQGGSLGSAIVGYITEDRNLTTRARERE